MAEPELEPALDDMIGCMGRTITWMQHAMDQQVRVKAADAGWAAGELQRLTAVLHLLEDLRGGAAAAPERQPKLHLAPAGRRRHAAPEAGGRR